MQVKIESFYSLKEIRNIMRELQKIGLIDINYLSNQKYIFTEKYNFFSLNDLLIPIVSSFVNYSIDDIRMLYYNNSEQDSLKFYTVLTKRLLDDIDMNSMWDCSMYFIDDSKDSKICVQISSISFRKKYIIDGVYQFYTKINLIVNSILMCHNIQKCYSTIEVDDSIVFLLMKNSDYNNLLENRLLYFLDIEYPEINEWIDNLDKNSFPRME